MDDKPGFFGPRRTAWKIAAVLFSALVWVLIIDCVRHLMN